MPKYFVVSELHILLITKLMLIKYFAEINVLNFNGIL